MEIIVLAGHTGSVEDLDGLCHAPNTSFFPHHHLSKVKNVFSSHLLFYHQFFFRDPHPHLVSSVQLYCL